MAGLSAMVSASCVSGEGRDDVERAVQKDVSRVAPARNLLTFDLCQGLRRCKLVTLDDLTWVETHDQKVFGLFKQLPSKDDNHISCVTHLDQVKHQLSAYRRVRGLLYAPQIPGLAKP